MAVAAWEQLDDITGGEKSRSVIRDYADRGCIIIRAGRATHSTPRVSGCRLHRCRLPNPTQVVDVVVVVVVIDSLKCAKCGYERLRALVTARLFIFV